MQCSRVDKTIREMLVGHNTGLNKSYYKPQDEEILQEYLKAIDSLTINNENKLKKQIEEVTKERDQIKAMEEKHKEELNIMREEMKSKFEQIMLKVNVDKIMKRE
jgi:protein-tyrosine-phosphatase